MKFVLGAGSLKLKHWLNEEAFESGNWRIFLLFWTQLEAVERAPERTLTEGFDIFFKEISCPLPCSKNMKINTTMQEKIRFAILMKLFCKLRPDF